MLDPNPLDGLVAIGQSLGVLCYLFVLFLVLDSVGLDFASVFVVLSLDQYHK